MMVVVGEASGDVHGARVVRHLRELEPGLDVFGVGGECLRREGLRVVVDVAALTGMGLSELLGNLRTLWETYRLLIRMLKSERPDLLLLVDFPEFNMRLARAGKRLGIPVLYYISPQVWAWRRGRIRKIACSVTRMAVVFPFEAPLYEQGGASVTFVGHPLLDVVRPSRSREETLQQHGLNPLKRTIALLPGSRRREVDYLLPAMVQAAVELRRQMEVQFLLARASTVERLQIEGMLGGAAVPISVADGDTYNVLDASDFAWVASGTATLEAALLRKPMVIVYRLAWLTYVLARLLVRVDHIGMVNILAGERVVPELIQGDVQVEKILMETQRVLGDPSLHRETVEKLGRVRERLGLPGAPLRVAEMAVSMMGITS